MNWTTKRIGDRWALVAPTGYIESMYSNWAGAHAAAARLNAKNSYGAFVMQAGAL